MSFDALPKSIAQNSTLFVQGDELDSDRARVVVGQAWRAQQKMLRDRKYWSQQKKDEYALGKLAEIVDFAFENVPMYRELYSRVGYRPGDLKTFADYERLPSIDKAFLRDVSEADRVASRVLTDREGLNKSTTSGSSGVPFTILFDEDSMLIDNLANFRMFDLMSKSGLTCDDRLYNVHHIRAWLPRLDDGLHTFTLNHIECAADLAQHLLQLRPKVFSVLPSYLHICREQPDMFRAAGVEVIVTNSEASSLTERRFYSQLFGVPVLDEYSSEEVGLMAYECEHRRYHLEFDFVHTSFVATAQEGVFRLNSTDLVSRSMPFIKFDHGDLVSISGRQDDICACGQCGPYIVSLNGRKDDAIVRPDGGLVPSAVLSNLVDTHFNANILGISGFQLIQQKDPAQFEFLYEAPKALSDTHDIFRGFAQDLDRYVGHKTQLTFTWVTKIPVGKSYKRKKVLSLIHQ